MFIRSLALAAVASLALSLTAGCASESSASSDDDNLTASSAARQGGSIETFTGVDGSDYFRLVAANGLTLLGSQGYSGSPDSAIGSLLKAAKENPARFQILEASNGGYYVNVAGEVPTVSVIATSEVYSSKSKAEGASKVMIGYLKGIATVAYHPAATGKRFDLYKLSADEAPTVGGQLQQYKFIVRADNGEAILFSEAYATKQAAQDGIRAVKDYGRLTANFEVSEMARGATFTLKAHLHSAASDNPGGASNNEAVGFSEIYANRSNATRGAEAVRSALQADLDVNDLSQ